MQTQLLSLRLLSDDELIARVNSMAGKTREVTASLIAHLAEMETRELHLPQGCSSMFTYCTRILRFSEHEAYGRIKAARVAASYPVVLDRLADGSLNMTAVMLLSPHLTPAKHLELFAAARHKTRQEVEKLVAALRPLPAVPTSIRKLPVHPGKPANSESLFPENAGSGADDLTPSQEPASSAAFGELSAQPCSAVAPTNVPSASTSAVPHLPAPTRPAVILALAPDRYKLQVTISESTQQKLRQAQELIRHQIPDGNTAEILDRALDLLVEKLKKQKFGGTGRKRRRERQIMMAAPTSWPVSLPFAAGDIPGDSVRPPPTVVAAWPNPPPAPQPHPYPYPPFPHRLSLARHRDPGPHRPPRPGTLRLLRPSLSYRILRPLAVCFRVVATGRVSREAGSSPRSEGVRFK